MERLLKKPIGFKIIKPVPYAEINKIYPTVCDNIAIPTNIVCKKSKKRIVYSIYKIPEFICINQPKYFEAIYGTTKEWEELIDISHKLDVSKIN